MNNTKPHIDKYFWESKHQLGDKYWLTGSVLQDIMGYHDLTEDSIKDKKILEIGVGLGNLSKELVSYTDKLICCDISENALSSVSNKVTKKYLTTDLNKIEPVDLAICHLVFQHCTDDEVGRIINDVVLTEDGIFTFQFAYLREGEKLNENTTNLINSGSHHFRSFDTIKEMVNKSNKMVVWESKPYHWKSPENFSWLVIKVKNKIKL